MSAVRKLVARYVADRTFVLPIVRGYVAHWGLVEAVRELLQNALDSDSPFEWEFRTEVAGDGEDLVRTLSVVSRNATLDPRTLLLGQTTKAGEADKIGSFGEGYKIAMLVLLREGYMLVIRNGAVVWRPHFAVHEDFGEEVLCVAQDAASSPRQGLEFVLRGLREGDEARIRASCLQMQGDVGEVIETSQARILPGRPGKLYIGGLHVCDTELRHGYDVRPGQLTLERDRQTVSTFDLKWLAKEAWFEAKQPERVARLIEDKCPDLEYAEHGAPELVKEACYRHFVAEHPGAVIAKDQRELEQLVEQGMTRVVVAASPAHYAAVSGCREYRDSVRVAVKTPARLLEEWFDRNRRYMRTPAIVSMKDLIKEADKWKHA